MSCCNEIYNLGCVSSCDIVSFGESTVTGTLTVVFENSKPFEVEVVEGEPYELDLSELNEVGYYVFKLYNEDGSEHTITVDDVIYDCFSFKTEIQYNLTPDILADENFLLHDNNFFLTHDGVYKIIIS